MKKEKIVVFDLWKTLIFGTTYSTIRIFYKEITGEDISPEQLKNCMLIKEEDPRLFLEKFVQIVTPANYSSVLLSIKNPRSPLYQRIVKSFKEAVNNDCREIRWLPGAIELLQALKSKYRLAVVSNLWAYQKNYLFNTLKIKQYCEECLFSCDLGMNKNNILCRLGKFLGSDIHNIVYVGESYEYDIIPAVNANLSAIKITNEENIIYPAKVIRMIDEEFEETGKRQPQKIITARRKNKKILIIIPPFYKLLGSHNNRINLGAASISSCLTSQGHVNKVYHCDSESNESYISRYQMIFNSINFYEAMEAHKSYLDLEQYYHNDLSDIVFITCGDVLNPSLDSGNWDSAQKVAKIIRKLNPKAFIVAVGPEIGKNSEDFDLLAYGEVEGLLSEIIEKKARGSIWGRLLSENELKRLPVTNIIKNIVTPTSKISLDTVIWRRGCIGTCDFCRVAQINKGKIRYGSIDLVMQEIKLRHDLLKIRNFYFVDANFTSDKKSVIDFCKRIKREFPGIAWRTESRFDTLDHEVLREMKEAGCTHLKLGLENALHPKHQARTKQVSIDEAEHWIKQIQKIGIKCVVYLMLGGKWFTNDQYKEMYKNARGLNADIYTISLFTPYPNTPAGISYQEWVKRKFIGSHLDIRLIDFWKIPIDIVDAFFNLELKKGREDKDIRKFAY